MLIVTSIIVLVLIIILVTRRTTINLVPPSTKDNLVLVPTRDNFYTVDALVPLNPEDPLSPQILASTMSRRGLSDTLRNSVDVLPSSTIRYKGTDAPVGPTSAEGSLNATRTSMPLGMERTSMPLGMERTSMELGMERTSILRTRRDISSYNSTMALGMERTSMELGMERTNYSLGSNRRNRAYDLDDPIEYEYTSIFETQVDGLSSVPQNTINDVRHAGMWTTPTPIGSCVTYTFPVNFGSSAILPKINYSNVPLEYSVPPTSENTNGTCVALDQIALVEVSQTCNFDECVTASGNKVQRGYVWNHYQPCSLSSCVNVLNVLRFSFGTKDYYVRGPELITSINPNDSVLLELSRPSTSSAYATIRLRGTSFCLGSRDNVVVAQECTSGYNWLLVPSLLIDPEGTTITAQQIVRTTNDKIVPDFTNLETFRTSVPGELLSMTVEKTCQDACKILLRPYDDSPWVEGEASSPVATQLIPLDLFRLMLTNPINSYPITRN